MQSSTSKCSTFIKPRLVSNRRGNPHQWPTSPKSSIAELILCLKQSPIEIASVQWPNWEFFSISPITFHTLQRFESAIFQWIFWPKDCTLDFNTAIFQFHEFEPAFYYNASQVRDKATLSYALSALQEHIRVPDGARDHSSRCILLNRTPRSIKTKSHTIILVLTFCWETLSVVSGIWRWKDVLSFFSWQSLPARNMCTRSNVEMVGHGCAPILMLNHSKINLLTSSMGDLPIICNIFSQKGTILCPRTGLSYVRLVLLCPKNQKCVLGMGMGKYGWWWGAAY